MVVQSQFIEMFSGREYPQLPIRDFADITTGSTPSKSHPEYWGGSNPWVSAEDMKDKYVYDTVEKVTDKGYATCKHIPVNTLMYVCRGSIGVMAINKVECATNQSICTATCKADKCEVEFLYHSLLYKKDEIKQIGIGTNFKSLNQTTFSNLRIFLPPIEEQRRFVSITTQADKSKFDGLKSQFIEMFGTPDNHPVEYDVKNLGDLSECYAGATPSTKVREYWDNGTIPWMSSGEVHMGHVTETESKITESGYKHASTKMVPVHSVVIALAGQGKTRGTVAITEIPLCTNQSLCAIVPSKDIHYEYLYHNLKGRYLELRGMAGDVNGRGGLNLKIVQSIRVIVPPLSEQMRFVGIAQQADKSKYLS